MATQPQAARLPDIYYIILDGYARTDVMKAFFDFDNTPFLDRLEKQGFYIARDSTANYCQTPLSLSASLNSVYLDDLVKGLGPDQTELSDLIGKSNIVATLRPLGYKFVTFATGFDPTEHPEADVYLSPHPFASGFERMVDRYHSAALGVAQSQRSTADGYVPGANFLFARSSCRCGAAIDRPHSRWPTYFAHTRRSFSEKTAKT